MGIKYQNPLIFKSVSFFWTRLYIHFNFGLFNLISISCTILVEIQAWSMRKPSKIGKNDRFLQQIWRKVYLACKWPTTHHSSPNLKWRFERSNYYWISHNVLKSFHWSMSSISGFLLKNRCRNSTKAIILGDDLKTYFDFIKGFKV